jgi:hypothetical protein
VEVWNEVQVNAIHAGDNGLTVSRTHDFLKTADLVLVAVGVRPNSSTSRAPIGVPEQVRPIIHAWYQACADPSPEALMFPTFGRGERSGQAVPRWGKNFLRWRVRPIARKFGIPDHFVTFQVMRRTMGTDLQEHGTLKDAQGALRHASI